MARAVRGSRSWLPPNRGPSVIDRAHGQKSADRGSLLVASISDRRSAVGDRRYSVTSWNTLASSSDRFCSVRVLEVSVARKVEHKAGPGRASRN